MTNLKTSKLLLLLLGMITMTNIVITEHCDILNKIIKLGDIVAYPKHNNMIIGIVKKINNKMINVIEVGRQHVDKKYPQDLLVITDPKITIYMLKKNK